MVRVKGSELNNPDIGHIRSTWHSLARENPILQLVRRSDSTGQRSSVTRCYLATCSSSCGSHDRHVEHVITAFTIGSGKDLSLYIKASLCFSDPRYLDILKSDFLQAYNGVNSKQKSYGHGNLEDSKTLKTISNAEDYWHSILQNVFECPLHTIQVPRGDPSSSWSMSIDEALTHEILQSSTQTGSSMQTLIHGAWALVLKWHTDSGNDTVAFTVGLVTQSVQGTQLSPATSSYPLVLNVQDELPIKHWLQEVEQSHQNGSEAAMVSDSGLSENAIMSSIQTRLTFLAPGEDPTCVVDERTKPVLDVKFLMGSEQSTCHCTYSSSIPEKKIQVLMEHFLTAIRNIKDAKSSQLGEIDIVSDQERTLLLGIDKPTTRSVEGFVHHLVECQARDTPEKHAVQFETETPLTYRNLNCLANGIARQLTCGPGDLVPVFMRQSQNLVLALLAVLKTGAAYVTMDPDVPRERNEFIVADTGAEFVVSEESLMGSFPNEVSIDRLIEASQKFDQSNLHVDHLRPSNTAYVIYTSGSTGKPKGVLLEHRAACSGLAASATIPNLRQLLFQNPIFSAAQRTIWSTLQQGGCLCITSKQNAAISLGKMINLMAVNTANVTPSTALLIDPGTVSSLQRLTITGEQINPALVDAWIDKVELSNAYGLSENTQLNWRRRIERGQNQNPRIIGRPQDTTTAFVLCPGTSRLCPLMVPGELCLGGHQLARAYLNRTENTAQAFIPNPFGEGRLYRTGDMAVTHEDGSIELIGRIDFQFKINDQRVEPGEANAIIQMHPSVSESAVVSARVGNKRALVASLVPRGLAEWSALLESIKSSMERRLPRYMIPTYWWRVEKIPLNVNGKVDVPYLRELLEGIPRQQLIQSSSGSKKNANADTDGDIPDQNTPQSEIKILGKLIAEVLEIPQSFVSMASSFDSLGGTSLEAILVSSKARTIGLQVDVQEILLTKSLHTLILESESNIHTDIVIANDSIEPFSLLPQEWTQDLSDWEDAYPATPLQEGMIADTIGGSGRYEYYRAFNLGSVTLASFKAALHNVIEANAILRTTFVARGAHLIQVVEKSPTIEWVSTQESPSQYVDRMRQEDSWVELDRPLVHAVAAAENSVVLAIHHALFDHWSSPFLRHDLLQTLKGKQLEYRPPYAAFVKFLSSLNDDQSDRFWSQYLHGLKPTLLESTAASQPFYETRALKFDIKTIASACNTSIAAMVYALWAFTVAKITGSSDVTFLVTYSGRDSPVPGIIEMNGPTLANAPLRVIVEKDDSLVEVAKEIQEEVWTLSKYAHFGPKKISQAANVPLSMFNSLVNVLVATDHKDHGNELKAIPVTPTPINDLLTVEVDVAHANELRMMSRADYPAAKSLLECYSQAIEQLGESIRVNGPTDLDSKSLHSRNRCDQGFDNPKPSSDGVDPAIHVEEYNKKPPSLARGDTGVDESSYSKDLPEPCILNTAPVLPSQSLCKTFTIAKSPGELTDLLYTAWTVVLAKHNNTDQIAFGLLRAGNLGKVQPVTISLQGKKAMHEILQAESNFPPARTIQVSDINGRFDSLLALGDFPIDATVHETFTTMCAKAIGNWCQLELRAAMDVARMGAILEETAELMRMLANQPNAYLDEYDVIAPQERSYLHSLADYRVPSPQLLHTRFKEVCTSQPHSIALNWENQKQLTYEQLDQASSIIASHLVSYGVAPGDLVPTMFEKSFEAVISFLAILKSGAAYVPISADNPDERNGFIIDDTKAKLFLTQRCFGTFAQKTGIPTLYADDYPDFGNNQSTPRSLPEIDPFSLAYCIYTSGSTGVPKGVMVPHSSASCSVGSMLEAEGRFQGHWRVLQFADYVFDASVQDIFNTLSSGGTLCMSSRDRLLSELPMVINEMQVSHAILTPTVAELLQPADVPTLTTMIVGGEVMTQKVLESWTASSSLLNVYGPTETSMVVATKKAGRNTSRKNVGKPFKTVAAAILDVHGTSYRPIGAVGELCIAGPQVTAGYINRPDLTEQQYTQSVIPGTSTMYRTGDLARWLPGGEIEILGRKDGQIKIAGHRIELDEIEIAIKKSGLVENCVVQPLNVLGRLDLAAFVIFGSSEASNSIDSFIERSGSHTDECRLLRKHLNLLASYMVPKYIFPMRKFPRLPSQKTDRKRLTARAESIDPSDLPNYVLSSITYYAQDSRPTQEPVTEQETLLRRTWAEMFGVPEQNLHRDTNFFEIGGDSIAAINTVNAVRKSGWALSVRDILSSGMLSTVAEKISRKTHKQAARPKSGQFKVSQTTMVKTAAAIDHSEIETWYPVPPGSAEFLSQGAKPEQFWVLMTVRALPPGADTLRWLSAVRHLALESPILRSTFIKTDGDGWVGAVLKSPDPEFMTIECSRGDRQTWLDRIWNERFIFGKPFVRYVLLSYKDGGRDLITKMDHGLWDGTLLRLFDEHFDSILHCRPALARESFQVFCTKHYESQKSASLDFWRQMIRAVPENRWPSLTSPRVTRSITRPLDVNIDDLAAQVNVTVPTVFQAAFQLWLTQKSRTSAVSPSSAPADPEQSCCCYFDYLLTGRNIDLPDPQRINGNCANFLPFRMTLHPSAAGLAEYLNRTQTLFWEATEHGCVGLDDIYGTQERRDALGNQVLFLYQPFEPRVAGHGAAGAEEDECIFVNLAKSEVRMVQPYALVVEVSKAAAGGHNVKVMWDERFY